MHAFVFLRFTGAGGDAERYPRWCRSLARGALGWSDLGGHPPESPGSKLMASYKEATRDTCYLNPCHNPAKELITRPRLHYQSWGVLLIGFPVVSTKAYWLSSLFNVLFHLAQCLVLLMFSRNAFGDVTVCPQGCLSGSG